jgi:hypothetical protein
MGRPARVCHPRSDGRMIQPAHTPHTECFTATEALYTLMLPMELIQAELESSLLELSTLLGMIGSARPCRS